MELSKEAERQIKKKNLGKVLKSFEAGCKRPTSREREMEQKKFSLEQWVENRKGKG